MEPTSVGGAFGYGMWWIGELAFRWIPGTVINVAEGGPLPYVSGRWQAGEGAASGSYGPITHAVTPLEAAQFIQGTAAPDAYAHVYSLWSEYVAISLFLSLLFFSLVVYCFIRISQVRQMERRRFAALQQTVAAKDVPRTVLRWQRIIEQARSDDPQSWRLAILEADIMLNELLETQGYRGETMADKMKQVERGDFQTIDMAWEAHKVRNRVAHEGANLDLSQREARRVLSMYERVFREFHVIE